MEHAILGTDLSKASDKIIENSTKFKLLGIKKITLVFVLNLRSSVDLENYSIEVLEKRLAAQKTRLESKGFEVKANMVMGIPADELIKQVKTNDAALLIIGSIGKTWSKSPLGNIASDVLRNMRSPVLLMVFDKKQEKEFDLLLKDIHQYERIMKELQRKEPDSNLLQKNIGKHVLLTTDFSDSSENAFQWLKNNIGHIPRLTLMHVQDEVRIKKHLEDKLEEFNKIDLARLNRLKEAFNRIHPATKVDTIIEYGNPKKLILKFIDKNDVSLTVMGSQGRGYLSEIFLGSVSHQMARHAVSNVLLIPLERD